MTSAMERIREIEKWATAQAASDAAKLGVKHAYTILTDDVLLLLTAFNKMREIAIKAAVGERERTDIERGRRIVHPYKQMMELTVDREFEEALKDKVKGS